MIQFLIMKYQKLYAHKIVKQILMMKYQKLYIAIQNQRQIF